LTDSLRNLMAQRKIYTRGNRKIAELKDLLADERANLKIMWIPAQVGIGGNERTDRAAKDALEQKVATGHKVRKRGLKKNSKEIAKTTGATLETLWWQLNRMEYTNLTH
jgi:ribonuclease HI